MQSTTGWQNYALHGFAQTESLVALPSTTPFTRLSPMLALSAGTDANQQLTNVLLSLDHPSTVNNRPCVVEEANYPLSGLIGFM
ncbi:hypothetical protein E4U57_002653 [Claviceps arundinis]|uniref:Uncharacterized protein n=1 Tax=Claviceps arundinis TaxID=1623583 RepID=A0ABQ7PK62_9HYPO|nr:hypothetical protein E4U57_002653 [Claviceps arundinis]